MAVVSCFIPVLVLMLQLENIAFIYGEPKAFLFKAEFENLPTEIENLTIQIGSQVNLTCECECTTFEWFRDTKGVVYGNCTHYNPPRLAANYSARIKDSSHFTCTKNSIAFSSFQREDGGEWYCIGRQRQSVPLRSKRKRLQITMTTEQTTERETKTGHTTVRQTSSSTTVQNMKTPGQPIAASSIPPSKEIKTPGQPIAESGSPKREEGPMVPVIGAAVGGFLLITMIAVVIGIMRRKRNEGQREPAQRNGTPTRREDVFEEEDFGQYAQIGDSKKREESNGMEDNPLYHSYQNGADRSTAADGTSYHDVTGDVYSVVQKPIKSVDDPKGPQNQELERTPATHHDDDVTGDVYSVVQKPIKSLDDQNGPQNHDLEGTPPTHHDDADDGSMQVTDLDDVYSVVQKPKKE